MKPIIQETPQETQIRCDRAGAQWLGDRVTFAYQRGSVDLPRDTLRAIFARYGLEECLTADPRPETLLKAAARQGKRPKGYLSREFVSPLPDTPISIHVTRVEGTDESGDEYTCLARVRIGYRDDPANPGCKIFFATARPPEGQAAFADETARDRAVWIAAHVNHQLTHVLTSEALDAIRKAVERMSCVKSLGGGNNYFVPTATAKRVHDFLRDLQTETKLYFERSPQTTLGSVQERAVMGQAAQVSLLDDLEDLESKLAQEIEAAANPTKTRTGKVRTRDHYIQARIDSLREVQGKLALYESVVEQRVTQRISRVRDTLEKHFTTLLGGGEVIDWTPSVGGHEGDVPSVPSPAEESSEPKPSTQRSVTAPPSSEALAAAPTSVTDSDPYSWC